MTQRPRLRSKRKGPTPRGTLAAERTASASSSNSPSLISCKPSPDADVAWVSPVLMQMWHGRAQS